MSELSPYAFDFNDRPFVVIWETTRACALACRHCRAEADPHAHPLQLSTEEGFALIDQIAEIKPPVFVLTGGDPAMRPDLLDLINYSREKGLFPALSPSATPRLVKMNFHELKRAGVHRISLSIDGPDRASHDAFRGVKGTWDWTLQAYEKCFDAGIPVQINTTITKDNADRLDDFIDMLEDIEPVLWSVFVLVPTGRGKFDDLPSPAQLERLLIRLHEHSLTAPYEIKTTEAPMYRRVQRQHPEIGEFRPTKRAPLGINDGKGFVFVSHTGEVNPSGFLPLNAGNVRTQHLLDIYRNNPTFQHLRDPNALMGKCGQCEYRSLCGGSRARAYAMSGNPFDGDPLCEYQPPMLMAQRAWA
ncbi:MAG: radical SAM protein [Verrucomicrobiaceae bacterium]|nr:radical SAM protein [Verrucomicrobiaceae bacterium]